MKKINLQIDDETADRIVICTLRNSIQSLDEHIAQLKKNKKKLQKYQKTDLAQALIDRDALKQAHNYYGGDDV